jgi:multicomponent Na+:H+ antiporter subunit A
MLPLIALSPLIAVPAAAWLGKRRAPWSALLAICPAAIALYFCSLLKPVAEFGPRKASLPWAQSLGLALSFYVDGLSLLFAILITGIGALIVVFASKYFDGDPRAGRFQATLFAFMGSMLGIVLADNLLALFVFWELTGFTSFLLIGFDHERTKARASAVQALIVTGTGGMALLGAALLMEQAAGTLSLSAMLAGSTALKSSPTYLPIVLLALLAAFTKSAQAPFDFWLPNAMSAPTPVSAYLHSATMVKAGIYLVARMTPLIGGTPLWTGIVTTVGAITMILGAWRSVAETDLKRLLAFSTISALGLLMMLLGLGTQAAVTAAIVYLLAHACYKGALFLVAGTLEHETGSRDAIELGGLGRSMPLTAAAAALAAASMAGIPLFLGFTAKELFYEALLDDSGLWAAALVVAAVGVSALLGTAGLVAGVRPFTGAAGEAAAKHPVPVALVAPPLVLALAGVVVGVWPAAIDTLTGIATAGVLRPINETHLAMWHGLTPVLALSLLTFAGVFIMYNRWNEVRRRIWPRSFGFERLYTLSIQGLDALSSWSSPALQSASLRSYVLALIMTAAVLLAGVLALSSTPRLPALIDVRPHEAAAVVMIIAGSLSAARAASTISAVLSLGVTGYGVALTFLFFGAPDLAMTQFSVETLTAVIFTLVFYHFRGFGLLSPWAIRLRDMFVSVLFGASIAMVLLFVGATETPARLSSFFADAALPLAHGRNIVNVILVDFRALDTLGEITVLATAALGVRAVLRLGRGEEKKS